MEMLDPKTRAILEEGTNVRDWWVGKLTSIQFIESDYSQYGAEQWTFLTADGRQIQLTFTRNEEPRPGGTGFTANSKGGQFINSFRRAAEEAFPGQEFQKKGQFLNLWVRVVSEQREGGGRTWNQPLVDKVFASEQEALAEAGFQAVKASQPAVTPQPMPQPAQPTAAASAQPNLAQPIVDLLKTLWQNSGGDVNQFAQAIQSLNLGVPVETALKVVQG